MGKLDPGLRLEPLPDEVLEIFCDEQDIGSDIAQITVAFMQCHPTEDIVNKISRMYEMIDKMTFLGDLEGIKRVEDVLVQTIKEYTSDPPKIVDERTDSATMPV